MTVTPHYVTTDATGRWSGGGSPLTAAQVDENFYLVSDAVNNIVLETPVGVTGFRVESTSFYVELTDASELGPFELPVTQYNPRGNWTATTLYAVNDTVSAGGSLYVVLVEHTSGGTFSSTATDGLGNYLYGKMIDALSPLPTGGDTAMALVKSSSNDFDAEWAYILPTGGATGHVLTKISGADFALTWSAPAGATGATGPSGDAAINWSVDSTVTGAGTASIAPGIGAIIQITPTGNLTIDASSVVTGPITFIFTTSGLSSYTMTFGTNFKSTGTLATGAVSGKVFTASFMGDGTTFNEVSRTTAM